MTAFRIPERRADCPGNASGSCRSACKTPITTALVLLFLGLLACGPAPAGSSWTVLKVYDGDTVLASGPDGTVLVRLVGIDAPERGKGPAIPGQPYSRKSRDHLSGRLKQRRVTLIAWGEDRFGRLLGEVVLDGVNINREMVAVGLAEVYRGHTPEGFDPGPYRAAESDARAARKGIWSLGDRYVSPVEWKHRPR